MTVGNSEGDIANMAIPPGKLKLGRTGCVFFMRNPFADIPDGESLIEGGFVYTVGNKPLSVGCAKTGAYGDENRKLCDVLRVECVQEFTETNASGPLYNYRELW